MIDGEGLKTALLEAFQADWAVPMTQAEISAACGRAGDDPVVRTAVRQLTGEGRLVWRHGYELGEWDWPGRRDHVTYHATPEMLQKRWEEAAGQAPWVLADPAGAVRGRFADEQSARAAAERFADSARQPRKRWAATQHRGLPARLMSCLSVDRLWEPVRMVYCDGPS